MEKLKATDTMSEEQYPVLFEFIEMLRNEESKRDIGFNGNVLRVTSIKNKFYVEDVEYKSHEEIRELWKRLNPIEKLKAETKPIPYQPNFDWVIIRPFEMKAFNKTSVLLPENVKTQSLFMVYREMPFQGIVVAVGPGFFTESGNRRPTEVVIGDHVALEIGTTTVSDFIFNNILYYKTRASMILGKYDKSVGELYRKLPELKFLNPK